MRISEEYSRSGYFWLPSNPERKIPGTVLVRDGGKVQLEILDSFNDKGLVLLDDDTLPRICGLVEKESYITLEDCFFTQKVSVPGGCSRSTIHVGQFFSGVAYDHEEEILFHSFCFSIEGLDEWVGLSGIGVKYSKDFSEFDLSFRRIKNVEYKLPSNLKLKILYSYNLPGPPFLRETTIKQKAYLQLTSEGPRDLSFFQGLAHRINNLLSLAIDKTVAIDEVVCFNDELAEELSSGATRKQPISVVYSGISFLEIPPQISVHTMLFRLQNVKNLSELLEKWFEAYDILRPAIELYFNSRLAPNKYNEGKFLSLAQGVETLHRRTSTQQLFPEDKFKALVSNLLDQCDEEYKAWLSGRLAFGNELPLRKRLLQIIKPFSSHFGNAKDRKSLVTKIVDSRNYFTHYSKELQEKVARGQSLWSLSLKLEAMLQLSFLKILGFSDSDIDAIVENNLPLKQKLSKKKV